jgi:hypothetical protein
MNFNNQFVYKRFYFVFLWHWKKVEQYKFIKLLSDFGGTSADFDGFNVDPEGLIRNGDYRIDNGLCR